MSLCVLKHMVLNYKDGHGFKGPIYPWRKYFGFAFAPQSRINLVSTVLLPREIRKMSTSILIEVFGHILYSFTRGVTEHYNPDEPEFTFESFGYNPLESTGREWYCHPVDELIYQEYSDREPTSLDYLPSPCSFGVKVTDACSAEQDEETQEVTKMKTNP